MVWWWPAILGRTHTLPPALGPYVPGWSDVMTGECKDDGIFIRLYYPTCLDKDQDHSNRWGSWLPDDEYLSGFAYVLGLWKFLMYLLYKLFAGNALIPAVLHAPIIKHPAHLRTAVFSHGMGGTRFLYSNICCEMAAHGYVVAAVEHRDQSASMTWFYSNRKALKRQWLLFKHVEISTPEHTKLRLDQVQQRATEAARALDFLRLLDGGNVSQDNALNNNFDLSMFQNRLDLTAPVMMGHSFGGATTLLTLSQTPAFKMGILLDPWMFPIHKRDKLWKTVHQPILCINMQSFQIAPNLQDLSKYMSDSEHGARISYSIRDTTHENQSDSVHLVGYWLNFLMKKIDPTIATRINNALIIRFLREHAGLEGTTLAEAPLKQNGSYVEDGLAIDGVYNKPKKIPNQWLTFNLFTSNMK